MQALRAALTPLAKKQRTDEISLSSDDDGDAAEEQDPGWAARQEGLLNQILSRLSSIEDNFREMQTDIAQAKFQAGVAQSLAEEAMDKVEKMNDNIKNIEESILTRSQVQEMIETSLHEFKGKTAPFVSAQLRKGPNTFINDIKNVQADEKFSRTAVIGCFP